ncbi:MAG TPA: hypothetical protein VE933_10295 [Chitinophagaceae bacterium]|nr:hypothetical protein [Chitinophagaceae bacterium]
MRTLLASAYAFVCFAGTFFLLTSCSKKNETEQLPVINPTVNPISYSTIVYLLKPTDKSWNPSYYNAAKSSMLQLKDWYKNQLGKTFILNPVVVDTLSGLHASDWYADNNGPEISGSVVYAYNNVKYEMKQLLGSKFDTSLYTYFVYVQANIPDETVPRGLAVEGSNNLDGLVDKVNFFMGMDAHALAHAFGLPEPTVETSNGIMSAVGIPKWPNCVFTPEEKDSLNVSPFLQGQ